jgi:hypothetical protein
VASPMNSDIAAKMASSSASRRIIAPALLPLQR